ncbi:MAG: hypothetical protein UT17_C0017G0009 [Candidatus Woesebacteria bacterium GW2011_GWB1_39_10]|uniref:Uncharacterized protein n=1 Tax=Candidatus Woesebacteria bacterium GW2011_GWB1_39_10 TaxID=1618572 RepID=A0A0G0PPA8_9BACT|nr:MAG: hypothetical protein UT17_C0017G0009 [Candidatus Woesebacteria bacterium GW2011_GWB1_39_10]
MEQEICKCEHSRDMHDNRFSQFNDGEGPQKGEKDRGCKANDCPCEKYVVKEEINKLESI